VTELGRRAVRADDAAALLPLVVSCRTHGAVHGVPQPHDLTWLLAMPDALAHGAVWEDEDGPVAFALPRPAAGTVLFEVAPDRRDDGLPDVVVGAVLEVFSEQRAEECATPVEDDDPWRAELLARHGFADSGDGVVHLERSLAPPPALPAGPEVSPLGEGDLDEAVTAHRAAFGGDTMTTDLRRAFADEDGYRPELDLVVREGGRLIAFSVSYLRPDGVEIGTVGVLPEARGRGLARLLVDATGAVGAGLGATRVWTSTATDNAAMLAVARSAGFTTFRTTRWWARRT
jgi:GNAT superfamily N-acetyltransferase